MSQPADPEAWQRNYEAKLAEVEQRTERMRADLNDVRITERSNDGQVAVTVNSQGSLVDLQLGEALRQREGNAVAAEVLRLAQSAQGKIADAVQRAMEPYLGGTEAMNFMMDKLHAARAPETPQGFVPGGGGHDDSESFLRSSSWHDTTSQESTQPPQQPPPRGPARPDASNDDDDFGGSFLR